MKVDERIILANKILEVIGINLKLKEIEDVDSRLFILFYEKLLKDKIEGGIECPVTEKEEYENVVGVLDKLSREVLKVSLSHIRPMEVVRGKKCATMHLLEIFQALAECVKQQGGKRGPSLGEMVVKNEQKIMSAAAGRKQIGNLGARRREQKATGSSERQRFLAEKIRQLIGGDLRGRNVGLGRFDGDRDAEGNNAALLEYVNEHQEQLRSTRATMEELARARGTRGRSRNNGQSSGDTRELIRLAGGGGGGGGGCPDDELTCVTINDTIGSVNHTSNDHHQVGHHDDVLSCVSNETYVLDSVNLDEDDGEGEGDRNENQSRNLKKDIVMKDAWAQVNKDLIQQGYKKEFLDMLLDEEENINVARKQGQSNAELLRKFSQQEISCRPLSAFDELLRNEEQKETGEISCCRNDEKYQQMKFDSSNTKEKRNRALISSVSHGNSFVRAVEKPLVKHSARRYTPSSIGSISERSSTRRSDQETITQLLDSFPGLQLSEQTIRYLWSQAAQQAASIQQSQRHFISKLLPSEQKIEDARRRQKLLSLLMRKEALQQIRLQERSDERKAQIATLSTKEKQRQQSARAKRYVDEFAIGMKARMMHKQAREEQVFRSMFKEALKIQRDRINEMRRYARDVKNEHSLIHQKDLDSLENYYRDRFGMLADSLRKERNQINVQDKSQELALLRLKKEMRSKLENDIRMIQESLVQSQHELYFRELDAQRVLADTARK